MMNQCFSCGKEYDTSILVQFRGLSICPTCVYKLYDTAIQQLIVVKSPESLALYRMSDHWRTTARLRKEHGLEICGRCNEPADDVHHKHYETLGHERLVDLELLCRAEHEEVTFGTKQEPQPAAPRPIKVTGGVPPSTEPPSVALPSTINKSRAPFDFLIDGVIPVNLSSVHVDPPVSGDVPDNDVLVQFKSVEFIPEGNFAGVPSSGAVSGGKIACCLSVVEGSGSMKPGSTIDWVYAKTQGRRPNGYARHALGMLLMQLTNTTDLQAAITRIGVKEISDLRMEGVAGWLNNNAVGKLFRIDMVVRASKRDVGVSWRYVNSFRLVTNDS